MYIIKNDTLEKTDQTIKMLNESLDVFALNDQILIMGCNRGGRVYATQWEYDTYSRLNRFLVKSNSSNAQFMDCR